MQRTKSTMMAVSLTCVTACGLWVQSPKKPSGTGTTPQQQEPLPPPPPVEALAKTPAAAVALVETATKSAGGGLKGLSAGGASLALSDGEKIAGCAASNEPVSSDPAKNVAKDEHDEAVLPDSDADYAGGKFYCMIAANSGDESSVLGAFDLPKLVTCLAGSDIAYDGTEHVSTVEVATSPCFSGGGKTPDGLPPTMTVKVTAHKPAVGAGSGWDSSLDMSIHDGDEKVAGLHMLMMSTDTKVAVAFQGGGTETDAYAFNLDVAEGTMRYEAKFLRIPEGGFSDHTRLLIKGTVDKTGAFSAVSAVEGAYSGAYNTTGATSIRTAVLMTIKGDAASGFRTYGYKCSGDAGACDGQDLAPFKVLDGTGQCAAGTQGAACAGNAGITLAAPADLAFLMRPGEPGYEPAATWIAGMSPLAYPSVTLTQSQ